MLGCNHIDNVHRFSTLDLKAEDEILKKKDEEGKDVPILNLKTDLESSG